MSAGYVTIVVLVIVLASVSPAGTTDGVTVTAYGLGLVLAPILFLSFTPPGWLREIWRSSQERERTGATADLLAYSPDVEALAARALTWAVGMVGGEGGVIAGTRGSAEQSAGRRMQ